MLSAQQAHALSEHTWERLRDVKVDEAAALLEASIMSAAALGEFSTCQLWEPFNLQELHVMMRNLGYKVESRGRGRNLMLVVSWGAPRAARGE